MTVEQDPPQTLAGYLWHFERASPDRPLVSDGTADYTYAETARLTRGCFQ